HRPSFFELERRKAPTALSVADLVVPPLALAGGLSSLPVPVVQPTTLDRLDQDAAPTEDPVFAPPADANGRCIFSEEAQEQLPEDTPIEFGAIPNVSPRAAEVDQALSSYVFADVLAADPLNQDEWAADAAAPQSSAGGAGPLNSGGGGGSGSGGGGAG